MLEVSDETFERDVVAADRPVVVDFWAPWCRPCRAVAPIFDELAEASAGRVVFAKLNIDESAVSAARYGVLSIPTAILFEGGEPQSVVVGARSRAHYERQWARWLAAGS